MAITDILSLNRWHQSGSQICSSLKHVKLYFMPLIMLNGILTRCTSIQQMTSFVQVQNVESHGNVCLMVMDKQLMSCVQPHIYPPGKTGHC